MIKQIRETLGQCVSLVCLASYLIEARVNDACCDVRGFHSVPEMKCYAEVL